MRSRWGYPRSTQRGSRNRRGGPHSARPRLARRAAPRGARALARTGLRGARPILRRARGSTARGHSRLRTGGLARGRARTRQAHSCRRRSRGARRPASVSGAAPPALDPRALSLRAAERRARGLSADAGTPAGRARPRAGRGAEAAGARDPQPRSCPGRTGRVDARIPPHRLPRRSARRRSSARR